jgi:acetoacetyl-CoA synthetase
MQSDRPLWIPSAEFIEQTPMKAFIDWCGQRFSKTFADYDAFHDWSITERADFWTAVWDHCGVIGNRGERPLIHGDVMLDAQFFPDATLNFAENLLRHTGSGDALVFRGEDKVQSRMSWDDLRALVSRLQQALKAQGIGKGDRVAAMMPNMPETIALMLATASIGAIWSSCSPDFGEQGVLDRFGQIEPKLFIACDGYWYAGKRQDVAAKVQAVAKKLGVAVLIIPYAGDADTLAASLDERQVACRFHRAVYRPGDLNSSPLPFAHPLYILFSSGTTGVPKCIVHSAGGTLLQHLKEHRFHCSLRAWRKAVLFHHLRLDDVELAGLRTRLRRNALPVRRFAVPSPMATCCSTMPVMSNSRSSARRQNISTRCARAASRRSSTHDLSSLG